MYENKEVTLSATPDPTAKDQIYQVRAGDSLCLRTTNFPVAVVMFEHRLALARAQAQAPTQTPPQETLDERLQSFPDWAASVKD